MKNPLHYQLSEYDCGPTSLLNAIAFLFEREEIPPEVIRNIMLYCLDCYGEEGMPGRKGTSRAAMMFLSNWLNGLGQVGKMTVFTKYQAGNNVYLGQDSQINDALHRGGVVVVRLFFEEPHYVLLTAERDGRVFLFDPYYIEEDCECGNVQIVLNREFQYNRIVPQEYFNRETDEIYALGPVEEREAVILYNKSKMQNFAETIEYFI